MKLTIRRAVMDDRIRIMPLQKEIAALHHAGRPDLFRTEAHYYSEDEFFARLTNPDHHIFLAEADGIIDGYVFASVKHVRNHPTYMDFDTFYIDDLCVAESYRRHGIASALFERCITQVREAGCHSIELGVYCFNEDAIAFYRNMGMKPVMQRMELNFGKEKES